jgi:hypothetical protein
VLQDTLSINQLLCHETSGSEHGKTSVLEFLVLKGPQLLRISRLETEGVEANVTRGVLGTQEAWLVNDITRGHPSELRGRPSDLGTVDLELGNTKGKDTPERSRNLRKVVDGRTLNRCVEEEGRPFDLLSDKESNHSQHTNTSMGELGLTVTLEGVLVGLLGEAKRIEDTERGEGTRDGVDRESLRKENTNDISLAIYHSKRIQVDRIIPLVSST